MTKENADKNIGFFFWLKNERYQVTSTATFSGMVHFGFIRANETGCACGWVPAEIIGQCEVTK